MGWNLEIMKNQWAYFCWATFHTDFKVVNYTLKDANVAGRPLWEELIVTMASATTQDHYMPDVIHTDLVVATISTPHAVPSQEWNSLDYKTPSGLDNLQITTSMQPNSNASSFLQHFFLLILAFCMLNPKFIFSKELYELAASFDQD